MPLLRLGTYKSQIQTLNGLLRRQSSIFRGTLPQFRKPRLRLLRALAPRADSRHGRGLGKFGFAPGVPLLTVSLPPWALRFQVATDTRLSRLQVYISGTFPGSKSSFLYVRGNHLKA